jgi:hypothetical protein
MAEEKLKEKIEEAHMWYEDQVLNIKEHEARLAAKRESFILENAEAEMKQHEAEKKIAELNGKLI